MKTNVIWSVALISVVWSAPIVGAQTRFGYYEGFGGPPNDCATTFPAIQSGSYLVRFDLPDATADYSVDEVRLYSLGRPITPFQEREFLRGVQIAVQVFDSAGSSVYARPIDLGGTSNEARFRAYATDDSEVIVSDFFYAGFEYQGALALGILGSFGIMTDCPRGNDFGRSFRYRDGTFSALSDDMIIDVLVSPVSQLMAGDANQDQSFDQLDLVQVQQAAKYLTGELATWGEGDWNGAPGGSPGNPPPGDGRFDQLDIIAAQQAGLYLQGPYAAVSAGSGKVELIRVPEPDTIALLGVGLIVATATAMYRRSPMVKSRTKKAP